MDNARIRAISINVCCEYDDLKNMIMNIQDALVNSTVQSKMDMRIKPCYLYTATRVIFEKSY